MKTKTAPQQPDPGDQKTAGAFAEFREKQRKLRENVNKARTGASETRAMMVHHAKADLMIKRTAYQWAPWAVSGALFTMAAANTIAAHLTGDPATTGAYTLTAAVTVLGAATLAIKRRLRMAQLLIPDTPTQRRWMVLCAGAAMLWLGTAVLVGLDVATTGPALGFALMVGTASLSRTHWRRHRIPDPDSTGLPGGPPKAVTVGPAAPEDHDEEDQEEVELGDDGIPAEARAHIDAWNEYLLDPLNGTTIAFDGTVWGDNPHGEGDMKLGNRFRVTLPGHGLTFTAFLRNIDQIAHSLDVPTQSIIPEQKQPTDDNPLPTPRVFDLDIIEHSPIRKPVIMEGSRYRHTTDADGTVTEGTIDIGPYANGDGNATWRVYTGGDSMWGGFILGGTGSGKTGLMDGLAFSLAASGHTTVWYADGQAQHGSPVSSSFIPQVADYVSADADTHEDLLASLEEIVNLRSAELSALGARGLAPTPQRPGICVIIDEFQNVITSQNSARWDALSRIARKVCVSLVCATQSGHFHSFGRSESLRSQIITGNVLVLRVDGSNQAGYIPGLQMDPTQLPKIPGYGYTVASEGYGRTAPFRSVFCYDYWALWQTLGCTTTPLDRRAQGAANIATENRYLHRYEAKEAKKEGLVDLFAYYEAAADGEAVPGADADGNVAHPHHPKKTEAEEITAGVEELQQSQAAVDSMLDKLRAEAEAEIARGEAQRQADTDTQPAPPVEVLVQELAPLQYRVLEAIASVVRDGGDVDAEGNAYARTGTVVERMGSDRRRVNEAASELIRLGLAAHLGHGKYGINDTAKDYMDNQLTPA